MRCALRVAIAATVTASSFVLAPPAHAGHRVGQERQMQAITAVRAAKAQRGTPYRRSGAKRGGFDCSGLTSWAYRQAGMRIPRVARDQYRKYKKIKRWHLRPGDLVFFHHLGHVGMWVGRGRFVHSPHTGDHVRVARLKGWYRRSYVGAVRPTA
jgi:cell wall-associated NlpC family hydrolase